MTNKEKAVKLVEHYKTRYDNTCYLLWTDLEDIAVQMAEWKDEQWKEKAQTAFCYVHNCIGQCHNTVCSCELREKFDDIMNDKWPKVEKLKQSNHGI